MSSVYILGGAQTDFARNWNREGKTLIALLNEVVKSALIDVDINFEDINKLSSDNRVEFFVGNFIGEKFIDQGHLGSFMTEVSPRFFGVPSSRYEAACASSSVAIDAAKSKILSGERDVAIVVGWELMKTVSSKDCGNILGYASYYERESKNLDFPFPKLFGKLATETVKKYNLNKKSYLSALSKIAVNNYSNAKLNPLAQTRNWFMNYKQANSRGTSTNPFVGDMLASSDCSQITDGAAVVVLASTSYVKDKGLKNKPKIKGWGHRNAPILFDKKIDESKNHKYILPWTRQAVLDAYESSGLSVKDIDVFETHDCFTSSEFVALSCFGLCKPGDEIKLINDGSIEISDSSPVNPSGGLIGCGHPVGASGARMLLDCYRQVTSRAGAYQVDKSKNALMLNIGGSATTNYVYIVGC